MVSASGTLRPCGAGATMSVHGVRTDLVTDVR